MSFLFPELYFTEQEKRFLDFLYVFTYNLVLISWMLFEIILMEVRK